MRSGISVAIILGTVPDSIELFDAQARQASASPVVSEILVSASSLATSRLPSEAVDSLMFANEKLQVIHDDEFSLHAEQLNNLVAATGADLVLLMETAALVSTQGIESAVELWKSDADVVDFQRGWALTSDFETMGADQFEADNSFPVPVQRSGRTFLVSRFAFLSLRGYDERPRMQLASSDDLRARFRRFGGEIITVPEPYLALEFWDDLAASGFDPELVQARSELVSGDKTIFRNIDSWSVPSQARVPIVSVAIATHNRVDLLEDAISSVLYQSFQDFEVVIVDDGSENGDAVAKLIESFGDERLRLIRRDDAGGVSIARNTAADAACAVLTAVHDDDDIMLPDRLKIGVSSIAEGRDATYGGWINFNDATGEFREFVTKKGVGVALNSFNGQGPGHSTWTLPTKYIKNARYDERIRASVDHNLASRLAWQGVKWFHVGEFLYLRRVHRYQITAENGTGQKTAHVLTRAVNDFSSTYSGYNKLVREGEDLRYADIPFTARIRREVSAYLPDHLISRTVSVQGNVANKLMRAEMTDQTVALIEDVNIHTGRTLDEVGLLENVTLRDLVSLRRASLGNLTFSALVRESPTTDGATSPRNESDEEILVIDQMPEKMLDAARERFGFICRNFFSTYPEGRLLIRGVAGEASPGETPTEFQRAVLARRLLVAAEFGYKLSFGVFGFKSEAGASAGANNRKKNLPHETWKIVAFADFLPQDKRISCGFLKQFIDGESV